MKLKCIQSYYNRLTEGKIYDCKIPTVERYKDSGYMEIICDDGTVMHLHPKLNGSYVKIFDCSVCTDRKCNSCGLDENKV